jgi:hypothetical protein
MPTQDVTEPESAGVPGARRAARHSHRSGRRKPPLPSAASRRQRIPGLVWAATALNIGLMLIFSVLYPAYYGFDETGHVSRVLQTQNGVVAPTPGAAPYVDGVSHSYNTYTAHEEPPFANYLPLARDARPSMLFFGGPEPVTDAALPNQLAQHPPGYYLLAAGLLDVVPNSSHLAWDQTVGLLRLLDVLLLSPLPILCWALARRFARRRIALAAAFAPALIPALARLGGSTNNDDLLILLIGIFSLLTVQVLRGDWRLRTAIGIAGCVAIGLLVKGFALVLPPVALLAYLIAWRRDRGALRWAPVIAVVVGSALGGIWWLRNLIVYGAVQPAGLTHDQAAQVWPSLPPGSHVHFGTFLRKSFDAFITTFWGAFGLAAPPSLPGVLTVIATVIALALLVVAFIPRGRALDPALDPGVGGAGSRRVELAVLVLPTVLVLVPLLVHAWADYERTGQTIGIQGRYLYTSIVALMAISAAGLDSLLARAPWWIERVMPLLACLLALSIEITGIWVVLTKLWMPAHDSLTNDMSKLLHAIGRQSPWPGSVTAAFIAATATAALVALVASALAARATHDRGNKSRPTVAIVP